MRSPIFIACALVCAGCSGGMGDDALGNADGGDGAPDVETIDGVSVDSAIDGDASASDAPASCVVDGIPGTCLEVSECTGDLVATPGHCAGGGDVECCTLRSLTRDAGTDAPSRDSAVGGDASTPDGWCPTDPSARPNAALTEEAGDPTCPRGMLRVASFCVDRFEASVVIVNADGTETSWSPYYPPPSGKTYRAVSLRGAVPQGYISGEESQRACVASKKRLCTNTEWLRACQGPSAYVYPYGNTREPGWCNDARAVHPAVQCFGTSASWIWSEIGWPGIDQQASTVDRTGARSKCVTPEGAFDMMGNLHEWIYDDPSKYADPVKAIDFRGGFYADTVKNGPGCLYQTTAHTFTHWDYSTGFRCCADPRP